MTGQRPSCWQPMGADMAKAKAKRADPKEKAELMAWNATSAAVSATRILAVTNKLEDSLSHQALFDKLNESGRKVVDGDMTKAERMLIAQAESLQGIYSRLVEFAMGADLLPKFDTYMKLALRSQNQSRMTLETLSAIKNPPTMFVKQANVVQNGNQQVNNQTGPTHGGNKKEPNELLEQTHGNRLELGTQTETVGNDSALETVGAVHGT